MDEPIQGMDWLLKPVIPRLQWPRPIFKPKRSITSAKHADLIARETQTPKIVAVDFHSAQPTAAEQLSTEGGTARLNHRFVGFPDHPPDFIQRSLAERAAVERSRARQHDKHEAGFGKSAERTQEHRANPRPAK